MLFNIITMQVSTNTIKEEFVSNYSTNQINNSHISQCRICLEQDTQGIETLVSPCHCTGTLKFVHTECLKHWISKIVQASKKQLQDTNAFIFCELCKSKIYFSASSSLTCRNYSEIKEFFIKRIKLFVALTLLLIINLGFFAALLNYLVFVGFTTLKENNVVLVSLIISGQVIFSIVSVITIGALVKLFVLKKYVVIYLRQVDKKK